ncbi:MAG: hypothetical protein ACFFE3_05365 [Candidatus Thorarchaeota archaeon]
MRIKAPLGTALLFAILFMLVLSTVQVNAFTTSDDVTTTSETEDDDYDVSHEPEEYRDNDGRAWIQTDIMTVTLDPEMPSYQYWYTTDENGSLARFMVNFMMIVEFEDSNGDNVYQPSETLSFAPLDAFEWILKTGTLTDKDGHNTEVYAAYTKGGLSDDWEDDWFKDWMPGYEEESPEDESILGLLASGGEEDNNFSQFAELTLQFYAHIYMNDYNGTVRDDEGIKANYTVAGGVELKVDIEIGNFPYTSDTSSVAILNYLREDVASSEDVNHYFTLHEESGDDDHESEIEMDDLGEEFEDMLDDDVQEISFVEASTDVTRGFYRWLDKAVVTHLNGSKEAVDVAASYWTDGNGLLLFLAYPNFNGGSILHDPSVQLVEVASPYVPPTPLDIPVMSVAIISSVIIVAAVGLTLKRR